MKIAVVFCFLLAVSDVFAGNLVVSRDYTSDKLEGGSTVLYFKLETGYGDSKFLYIVNADKQRCRIPVEMLKNLGIDPVQLGISLRNDDTSLICYMSVNQFETTSIAYQIEVSSGTKP